MLKQDIGFVSVRHSLRSLLGDTYIDAVIGARARLTGRGEEGFARAADRVVDFWPEAARRRMEKMLAYVGKQVAGGLVGGTHRGASTIGFNKVHSNAMAPLSGWGYFRVGEDGRLYLATKSEHYHTPLGHYFKGYELVEHARRLGIPNATHNNTRGYIVRKVEEELIAQANGLVIGDRSGLERVIQSRGGKVLNRVLNLQTGSLAAETAVKLMLGRFYRQQPDMPEPQYRGRVPVIVTVGDDRGGLTANYHGTTIWTQLMRGLWPEIAGGLEGRGTVRFVSIRPNDERGLEETFQRYEQGRFKIAGFCHELVLMNYGGRLLERGFVRECYSLCGKHDVPTFADEIQSGLWSPELYMFREYGVMPSMVAIGKGFSGGDFAASRILFNGQYDLLPQFGALVTNGQEELSALSYLVTMEWARQNAEGTRDVGEYYEARMCELVESYPYFLDKVEGRRHLLGLCFHELDMAKYFVEILCARGIDISAQTYKVDCPPTALTKIPLIAGREVVDLLAERMSEALKMLERRRKRKEYTQRKGKS